MRIFRLPKTSRWIIVCALELFVLLLLYRIIIYSIFSDLFAGASPSAGRAFLLGAAFDARIVAVIVAIVFVLSFWPGLHYFKTSVGKQVAIGVFAFALAVIHIFYMADIVHLKCFHERLTGTIISDLAKHTERGNLFLSKIEWFPVLGLLVLLVWLLIFLARRSHKHISKMRGTENKIIRISWHAIIVIACIFFIHGGFRKTPLSVESASKDYNKAALQLAVTPFESMFGSLPKAHG